jgi:hypothetical protein
MLEAQLVHAAFDNLNVRARRMTTHSGQISPSGGAEHCGMDEIKLGVVPDGWMREG